MGRYRILSLDGGGIRGVLTTTLLDRLETIYPFLDSVDLFAGTSTGGVLALGLAAGYSPSEIGELYERHAQEVFADTLWDNVFDIGRLTGAEYDSGPLRRILQARFGDLSLDDLPRRVLISSFDLDNEDPDPQKRTWKPKFFHNFPGTDSDGCEKLVDVALRTGAAPTFFPIYQGYIDGGVVVNNPSMCALAQAIDPKSGARSIQEISLLSVGTGRSPQYIPAQDEDWGLLQWARHLVSLAMDASVDTADYQCRQVLGVAYHRLNCWLPEPISLDDVDRIPFLKHIGREKSLIDAIRWLQVHFRKINVRVMPDQGES